jgi:hypothetical protein
VVTAAASPLRRRVSLVLAAIELLAAACLVVLALWMWQQGQQPVVYHLGAGNSTPHTVVRFSGNWMGGAIVVCLPAGLAVADAGRRVVVQARPHRDREHTAALGTLEE